MKDQKCIVDDVYLVFICKLLSFILGWEGCEVCYVCYGDLCYWKCRIGEGCKFDDVWIVLLILEEYCVQYFMNEQIYWEKMGIDFFEIVICFYVVLGDVDVGWVIIFFVMGVSFCGLCQDI